MKVALKRAIGPTDLPIALADLKAYLRQDYDDQDVTITTLLKAAVDHAERFTGRAIMPQTFVLTLPHFPSRHRHAWARHDEWLHHPHERHLIRLPRSPLIEVVQVGYTDPSGAAQVLDPSAYQVDLMSEPGGIAPAVGQCWPATSRELNAVQITFIAGYECKENIPDTITQALYLMVGSWFNNREDIVVTTGTAQKLPRAAEYLLSLNTVSAIGFEVAT